MGEARAGERVAGALDAVIRLGRTANIRTIIAGRSPPARPANYVPPEGRPDGRSRGRPSRVLMEPLSRGRLGGIPETLLLRPD